MNEPIPTESIHGWLQDLQDRIAEETEQACFTPNVFPAMAYRPSHFRAFFEHGKPEVRAAAIHGLVRTHSDQLEQELPAALTDDASIVRVYAARSLVHWLSDGRPEASGTGLAVPFTDDTGGVFLEVEVGEPEPSQGSLLGNLFNSLGRALSGPAPVDPPAADPTEDDPTEDDPTEDDPTEANPGENEPTENEPTENDPFAPPSTDPPTTDPPSTDPFAPDPPATDLPTSDPFALDPPGEETPAESEPEKAENRLDIWLSELYEGEHRPEWTAGLVPLLRPMIESESAEERTAAALALIPLGGQEEALPVLLKEAGQNSTAFESATKALNVCKLLCSMAS